MSKSEITVTVSRLNEYVSQVLKNDLRLRSIRVSGEISGFKCHYASGHLYFVLKDEFASIRCVMFKSSAKFLRFEPQDGMSVIVSGQAALYPKDGVYQFYVSGMVEDGEGELYRQFVETKQKLEGEGLFERKRTVPFLPRCVGVVTSESGAAFHDICNVIKRRFPKMNIILAPASVQGKEAPAEISAGIRLLNSLGIPDVIIVGRGGGSFEELSCFNDEDLARVIFESKIPIISAVGHETDFTIADYVSDLRAPTPSAAAELSVPEYKTLSLEISDSLRNMNLSIRKAIDAARQLVEYDRKFIRINGPQFFIGSRRQKLKEQFSDLSTAINSSIAAYSSKLEALSSSIAAMNPMHVLERGYVAVIDENGNYLTKVSGIKPNMDIKLIMNDGIVLARTIAVCEENDERKQNDF